MLHGVKDKSSTRGLRRNDKIHEMKVHYQEIQKTRTFSLERSRSGILQKHYKYTAKSSKNRKFEKQKILFIDLWAILHCR